jgi:hypothetical protein
VRLPSRSKPVISDDTDTQEGPKLPKVNGRFCKRLKQIDNIEDAALNAVVKLACFAVSVGQLAGELIFTKGKTKS